MPSKREDKVRGLNGVSIGPSSIWTQVKRIRFSVSGHVPTLRDAWNQLSRRVVSHKTFEQVSQDLRLVGAGGLLGIERVGIAIDPSVVDNFSGRSG